MSDKRKLVKPYNDVNAKCPFFKYSDDKSIRCEGLIDNGYIQVGFFYNKDKEIQRENFCDCHFERCEVYRMLEAKYND